MLRWSCFSLCRRDRPQQNDVNELQNVPPSVSWVSSLQAAQQAVLALDGNWLSRLQGAAVAISTLLGAAAVRVYGAHPDGESYVWVAEARPPGGPPVTRHLSTAATLPAAKASDVNTQAPPNTTTAAKHDNSPPLTCCWPKSKSRQDRSQRGSASRVHRSLSLTHTPPAAPQTATPPVQAKYHPPSPSLMVLSAIDMQSLAVGQAPQSLLSDLAADLQHLPAGAPMDPVRSSPQHHGHSDAVPLYSSVHISQQQQQMLELQPPEPSPLLPSPRQQQQPAPVEAPEPGRDGSGKGNESNSGNNDITTFAFIIRSSSARVGALVIQGGPQFRNLAAAAAAINTSIFLRIVPEESVPFAISMALTRVTDTDTLIDTLNDNNIGGVPTASHTTARAVSVNISPHPSSQVLSPADASVSITLTAIQQLLASVALVCWGRQSEVVSCTVAGLSSLASAQLLAQAASGMAQCLEASTLAACHIAPYCCMALTHSSRLAAVVFEDMRRVAVGTGMGVRMGPSGGVGTAAAGPLAGSLRTGMTGWTVGSAGSGRSHSVRASREELAGSSGVSLMGYRRTKCGEVLGGAADRAVFSGSSYDRLAYDSAPLTHPGVAHVLSLPQTLLERTLRRLPTTGTTESTSTLGGPAASEAAATSPTTDSNMLSRLGQITAATAAVRAPTSPQAAVQSGSMDGGGGGGGDSSTQLPPMRRSLSPKMPSTEAAVASPDTSDAFPETGGPLMILQAASPVTAATTEGTPPAGGSSGRQQFLAQAHQRPQSQRRLQLQQDISRHQLTASAAGSYRASTATEDVVQYSSTFVPDVSKYVQDPSNGCKDVLIWSARGGSRPVAALALVACSVHRDLGDGAPQRGAQQAGLLHPTGGARAANASTSARAAAASASAAAASHPSAGAAGPPASLTLASYLHFSHGPLPASFLTHVASALEPVMQLLATYLQRRLSPAGGGGGGPLAAEWALLHDSVLSEILAREGLGPPPVLPPRRPVSACTSRSAPGPPTSVSESGNSLATGNRGGDNNGGEVAPAPARIRRVLSEAARRPTRGSYTERLFGEQDGRQAASSSSPFPPGIRAPLCVTTARSSAATVTGGANTATAVTSCDDIGGSSSSMWMPSLPVHYIRSGMLRPLLNSVAGTLASVCSSTPGRGSDAGLMAAAMAGGRLDFMPSSNSPSWGRPAPMAPLAELGSKIGQGTFGCVFLGTWQGVTVSIKVLPALGSRTSAAPAATTRSYPTSATAAPPPSSRRQDAPQTGAATAAAAPSPGHIPAGGLVSLPSWPLPHSLHSIQPSRRLSVSLAHPLYPHPHVSLHPHLSLHPHPPPHTPAGGPFPVGDEDRTATALRWQAVREAFELAALRAVSHPNIVQVFATYPDVLMVSLVEATYDAGGGGGAATAAAAAHTYSANTSSAANAGGGVNGRWVVDLPAVLVLHPQDLPPASCATGRVCGSNLSVAVDGRRWAAGSACGRGSRCTAATEGEEGQGSGAGGTSAALPVGAAAGPRSQPLTPCVGEMDDAMLWCNLLSADQSLSDSPLGTPVTAIVMEYCDAGSLADILRQGVLRRLMMAREHAAAMAAMKVAVLLPTVRPPPTQVMSHSSVLGRGGSVGGGSTGSFKAGGLRTATAQAAAAVAAGPVGTARCSAGGTTATSVNGMASWGSAVVYDTAYRLAPSASGKLLYDGDRLSSKGPSGTSELASTGGSKEPHPSSSAALSQTSQNALPGLASDVQQVMEPVPPLAHQDIASFLPVNTAVCTTAPSGEQPQPQPRQTAAFRLAPLRCVPRADLSEEFSLASSSCVTRSQTLPMLSPVGVPSPSPTRVAVPVHINSNALGSSLTESLPEADSPVSVNSLPDTAPPTNCSPVPLQQLPTESLQSSTLAQPQQQRPDQRPQTAMPSYPLESTQAQANQAAPTFVPLMLPPSSSSHSPPPAPPPRHQPWPAGAGHWQPAAVHRRPSVKYDFPFTASPPSLAWQQQPQQPYHPQPHHSTHTTASMASTSFLPQGLNTSTSTAMNNGTGLRSSYTTPCAVPPGPLVTRVPATPKTFEALQQYLAATEAQSQTAVTGPVECGNLGDEVTVTGRAGGVGAGGSAGGGGSESESDRADFRPVMLIVLELASALQHLHSRRLVHCDVKPSNVLLRSSSTDPRGWVCKLSDFGCVRFLFPDVAEDEVGDDDGGADGSTSLPPPSGPSSHQLHASSHMAANSIALGSSPSSSTGYRGGAGSAAGRRTPLTHGGGAGSELLVFDGSQFVGSVQYMAPELLRRERRCTSAVDVYSLGVLMWELTANGAAPYAGLSRRLPASLVEAICAGLRPAFGEGTPEWYRRLVESCWAPNPAERPIAGEVAQAARRWLEGGGAPPHVSTEQ